MSHFTIALSGLSDADAATFETALESLPDGQWQLVEDAALATLLVVDIDTVWGHMDWLRATANGRQVVAYTEDNNARHVDLVLTKPLRANDLAELLGSVTSGAKVSAPAEAPSSADAATVEAVPESDAAPVPVPAEKPAMQAPPVSKNPAEPVAKPEPSPPAAPEPLPTMTLGDCLLADKLAQPCSMQGAGNTCLQLDPERGGYTGPATLKPTKPLLDQPMKQAQTMAPEAIRKMREAPALPLTRLLWFAALCATPGQLAPNLDPGARYHLTRWPQIEREFPRHFRIATTMMKGPGTLGDIASSANAPIGDVADFINAYSVAGYVACEASADSEDDAPSETNTGMLSRLRRPFSRGGQQA